MDKCPTCHKYWEQTWSGEEYCPECGQTKAQATVQFAKLHPNQTQPREILRIVITYTPEQQFAMDLAERLFQEHNIDHHPTVFRNRMSSCEQKIAGKPQIVLGYQNLNYYLEHGFREYKTIAGVWFDQGKLTGKRAIWALVLHEFAHVIQDVEGRLFSKVGHRNKYHNEQFVTILRELQILHPYDEVCNA